MSDKKNELRVDLAGNPGVAAYFSDKKPGDKCSFTIEGTIKEVDPANDAIIGIDKVIHEDDSGEETEITPDADEPMKMEISKTPAEPGEEPIETTLGNALRVATKGAIRDEVGAY